VRPGPDLMGTLNLAVECGTHESRAGGPGAAPIGPIGPMGQKAPDGEAAL